MKHLAPILVAVAGCAAGAAIAIYAMQQSGSIVGSAFWLAGIITVTSLMAASSLGKDGDGIADWKGAAIEQVLAQQRTGAINAQQAQAMIASITTASAQSISNTKP